MSKRTKVARAVYQITFELEVNIPLDKESPRPSARAVAESQEGIVEEAVTTLIDEELAGHGDGLGTRCGLSFHDATMFSAKLIEVRK